MNPMLDISGLVTITVTSVILDVPDQSGRYIASDLIAGWAYIVGDHQGDLLARGQGVCPGSLETALRCAFLSAASQTQDASEIAVLVENKKAHGIFVALARGDARVRSAAGLRTVTVMTRPHSKAIRLASAAAERVAVAALREEQRIQARQQLETVQIGEAADVRRARIAAAACEWRGAAEWRRTSVRELPSQEQGRTLAIASENYASRLVAPFKRLLAPLLQPDEGRDGAKHLPPSLSRPATTRWLGDLSTQAAGIDELFREAGWS